MANAIKAIAALALASATFGCASTVVPSERASPTHRWVAQKDATTAEYNFDNTHCEDESSIVAGPLNRVSPEFIAYERCMTSRGYKLATHLSMRRIR